MTIREQRSRPRGRLLEKDRRRPTLPGGCPPSTIGAEGLNGSVRNGKRCIPLAIATENGRNREDARHRITGGAPRRPARLENCTQANEVKRKKRQDLDPLVPICWHALLRLH